MSSLIADRGQTRIDSLEKGHVGNISTEPSSVPQHNNLHIVDRNGVDRPEQFEDELISGYDDTLMGARSTLSSAEEKKLLRRIDWHLIPLLAVIYMLKSVDFTNVSLEYARQELLLTEIVQVSYARVMDKGTQRNILTELKMTSDQYNLVTTMYYVSEYL